MSVPMHEILIGNFGESMDPILNLAIICSNTIMLSKKGQKALEEPISRQKICLQVEFRGQFGWFSKVSLDATDHGAITRL